MKYPEHLNESLKPHYTYHDVFDHNPMSWIMVFIMANYKIDMHSQAFYEINIIIEGDGMHYIENQRMPIKKGDIFVIPPNVRHGYSSESRLDVFHILVHQMFMTRYAEELEAQPHFHILFSIEPMMRADGSLNLHLKIDDDGFRQIRGILDNLLEWTGKSDPAARVMCNSHALMFIAWMCKLYNENYIRSIPRKKIDNDTDFMKSISYIFDHYDQKIRIDELAKTSFLSRNAYINRFKKVMHMTPGDFILQYRLKKAEEILAQTNLSLSEAAEQTGFYDISHMRKSFGKEKGYLPADVRKDR
jgi:AraC-like DNA-binding protein/mannose-6-phosphate isomerase-like protein (cupin superfamily)